MIFLELSPEQIKQVAKLPESGMSWHRVDLILKDGSIIRDAIILNGSILAFSLMSGPPRFNVEQIKSIEP